MTLSPILQRGRAGHPVHTVGRLRVPARPRAAVSPATAADESLKALKERVAKLEHQLAGTTKLPGVNTKVNKLSASEFEDFDNRLNRALVYATLLIIADSLMTWLVLSVP